MDGNLCYYEGNAPLLTDIEKRIVSANALIKGKDIRD
jgi:hypothetical protein